MSADRAAPQLTARASSTTGRDSSGLGRGGSLTVLGGSAMGAGCRRSGERGPGRFARAKHHRRVQLLIQDAMGTVAPVEEARKAQHHQHKQEVAGNGGERKPRPQLEEALKCPRCESSNTKFCYYNNYNLSQPRFFCKACRRYWTQGGTLRNVPVGGGCRKNKGTSSCSTAMPPSISSITKVISSQNQHLVPSSTIGFPNVLPTFMSTGGFDVPKFSLPFVPPPSLSSLAPTPAPAPSLAPIAATATWSSFLDMLRSGLVDNQGSGYYGPTIAEGGEMDVLLPTSSNFDIMQQYGVVGDNHDGAPINGATEGGQWPASQHGPNNGGSGAVGSDGGQ